jgi:hypothetical protein
LEEQQGDREWVQDAERWICQIQGVRQCRIDLDNEGEVTGVHVVSHTSRDPRRIVRDVEGLLKARLNLDVYYKKIGVVQILDQDRPAPGEGAAVGDRPVGDAPQAVRADQPAPAPVRPAAAGTGGPALPHPALLVEEAPQARVECAGVVLESRGPALHAVVSLSRGDATARREEQGPNHPGMDAQLLARATVRALQDLLDEPVTLSLADLRIAEVADERLTLAAVDLVEGRRSERFYGCCSQRYNAREASVYAVLDALNRRLTLYNFKEETAQPRS